MKKLRELRIESNHVEAFALESSSSRLFVNITDKHEVAVVDREAMKEIARWPIGSQADNSPMAYDEQHHRLLIVCRKPGTLVVMDADSGKAVAHLPAAERSDDIAFDAAEGRVYVPGGEGYISVFQQKTADQYELAGKVTSEPRKATISRWNWLCKTSPARLSGPPALFSTMRRAKNPSSRRRRSRFAMR